MAGLGSKSFDESAATPGRETRVRFDISESVLAEPGFFETRGPGGTAIEATTGSKAGDSWGVIRLASGYWALAPLNHDHYEQHETDASTDAVMRLSEFQAAAFMAEKPTYRRPDELASQGVLDGAATDLQASGDHVLWAKRSAGATWTSGLVSALPMPEVPARLVNLQQETHVAMDRVLEATTTHASDTGYLLRWDLPGNPFTKVDYVWRFYFGGPIADSGLGQFCLTFGGNGRVYLHERDDDPEAAPPAIRWVLRDSWQFANPQDTVNTCHVMRIIPHASRFIEFKSHLEDEAANLMTRAGAKWADSDTSPVVRLYTVPAAHLEARGINPVTGPMAHLDAVTGSGQVRVDIRRDLSPTLQISRLVYRLGSELTPRHPSGEIVDSPVCIPWGLQSTAGGADYYLTALVDSMSAGAYLEFYHAETGDLIPRLGGGETSPFWDLPGGTGLIIPKIQLTAAVDAYAAEYVRGYWMKREPVLKTLTPGEFTATPYSMSITGPTSDPTQETARFTVHDLNDSAPRLAKRGLFSVQIETDYTDPIDRTTKTSILFRGYAKPRITPRPADGRAWPTTDWRQYEIDCAGWWRRLEVQLFTWLPNFAEYWLEPGQPWKVTDVIRTVLGYAGFADDQIDVPDMEMRLWPSGQGSLQEIYAPAPGTSMGEYVRQLAASFLGAYLLPDPNAGDHGMWRLLTQPTPGTPLWTFKVDPGTSVSPRLAHCLSAYPDGLSPILKVEGEPSLRVWIEPPEASAVFVCAPGELLVGPGRTASATRTWMVNTAGVDWEPAGTTADPEHADYMPYGFAPVIDVDSTITAGPNNAWWMARRLYDRACRAIKFCSFTAHLVLVQDPSDTYLAGKRRPPRYGDSVALDLADGNGVQTWLVRSCNADWDKDSVQTAYYECQLPNPSSV